MGVFFLFTPLTHYAEMFFTLVTLLNELASKAKALQARIGKKKLQQMRATLDKRSVEVFKATETLTVVLVDTSNAAAGKELLTGGNLQKAGKTTDGAQTQNVVT